MEKLTWTCLVSAAWTSYVVLASEHNLHSHILVYDGDEHINATKGCGGLKPPFQLAPNPECIFYCLKEIKNNQSKEQGWSYDHYQDGTLCAYPDENATDGFAYGVCSNFSCNTSAPVNVTLLKEIMKRPSAPTTISPKPSSTTKKMPDHFDDTTTISPKSTSTTENITGHVDQTTTISPKPSPAPKLLRNTLTTQQQFHQNQLRPPKILPSISTPHQLFNRNQVQETPLMKSLNCFVLLWLCYPY